MLKALPQEVVVRISRTAQAAKLSGCSLLREGNVRPQQRTASGPLIGTAAELLGRDQLKYAAISKCGRGAQRHVGDEPTAIS